LTRGAGTAVIAEAEAEELPVAQEVTRHAAVDQVIDGYSEINHQLSEANPPTPPSQIASPGSTAQPVQLAAANQQNQQDQRRKAG
jgi:hypothetical protein